MVLIVLFYFLYIGAEVSVTGWIHTYAVQVGLMDRTMAAYLTSAFFGALTLARLVAIPVATRFRPGQILLGDLLICLASGGLLLLFPMSVMALWAAVLGVGIGMASLFPTMLDFAQNRMTLTGRINGIFFFGGSSGGMTVPWLIGQFFESTGPQVMVWSLMICLGLATLIVAFLRRVPPNNRSCSPS